jgi:hypothetical protein
MRSKAEKERDLEGWMILIAIAFIVVMLNLIKP